MQLIAFRVLNYRSILDSDWVDTSDITVIVGKNESGKTSLLKALHKFNPFRPESYSIDREWPRGHRNQRSPDAPVVEVRFEFTEAEQAQLAQFTQAAAATTGVEIAKTYKGDFRYKFLPADFPDQHDPKEFVTAVRRAASHATESASTALSSAIETSTKQAAEVLEGTGIAEFRNRVAALTQAVDQAVQADNSCDSAAAQAFKQVLAELNTRAGTPSPKKQAEEVTEKLLPVFIYMDDHRPFSGLAYLNQIKERKDKGQLTEEDKTILMILEMAGLDFEKEHGRASAQDKEQRMLDMNDASLTLTNMIAHHWSQRRYNVRFEADGHHLIAFVSDELQPALVPLNERSKGFQWFFSFDMTFMYETDGTFKNAVILLDEPGLHLHAAAQRDLLARMREYAQGNQLIYTTHMPFMIDMNRLDNIRVCVESKDVGTKATSDFYAADEHARFPLQAALGLSISQSLFVGQFNLVVEGVTDFWLLSTVATMLREAGRPSLDERIVITPCGGATKAAYVGTMLQGQQLNVVVLLDSDPEGRKVAEGLIKQWIMKDRHVLLIGNAIGRGDDCTVEDLFPLDYYLTFVNQAYQADLGGRPITAAEVNARRNPLLTKRVDEVLITRGLQPNADGWAFNKGRPAKLMLRDWAGKRLGELPAGTCDSFEHLFTAVSAAMPALSVHTEGANV